MQPLSNFSLLQSLQQQSKYFCFPSCQGVFFPKHLHFFFGNIFAVFLCQNPVKQPVQVKSDQVHIEYIFFGKGPVFSGAVESEDTQEGIVVNNIDLQGVVDMIRAVAFLIDGAVQAFVVGQQLAFADDHRISGVHGPQGVVLLGHAHIRFFHRKKFLRDTDRIRKCGLHGIQIGEKDAAVKAKTWEELKMLSKDNEYLQEAADSIYMANADEIVRQRCLAREEAERRERTLERDIRLLKEENEKLKKEIENLKKKIGDGE